MRFLPRLPPSIMEIKLSTVVSTVNRVFHFSAAGEGPTSIENGRFSRKPGSQCNGTGLQVFTTAYRSPLSHFPIRESISKEGFTLLPSFLPFAFYRRSLTEKLSNRSSREIGLSLEQLVPFAVLFS